MKTALDRIADALEHVAKILDRAQQLKPPNRVFADETLHDRFERGNKSGESIDRGEPERMDEST